MLRLIMFILVVVLGASTVSAQEWRPIMVDEWRAILDGTSVKSDPAMIDRSASLVAEGAKLLEGESAKDGVKLAIGSLVLHKHVSERMKRRGLYISEDMVENMFKLRSAMRRRGVPDKIIVQSAESLADFLREPRSVMNFDASLAPRAATQAEKNAMISVVRPELIDPTAPIFGEASVIGDRGCLTVNSKNRFGGYTGNQQAYLIYDNIARHWVYETSRNDSHSICLIKKSY